MSISLNGRVALVSGASRGLGAEMAQLLAARGASVALNYHGSRDRAQTLVHQIVTAGGKAIAIQADVTDATEVNRLASTVESELGPVDILVINATGPQPLIPLEKLTWDDMQQQLNFFVKSPLLLGQAVIPSMRRRKWGRIINIGSEVFEKGVPEFSNYVSAKGAQLGLTRSWALELAKTGITVNIVSPGWIPTERHAGDSSESKAAYAAAVPMGHMGEARDVAEAVAFLASDAAKFITGQKISVNGGNTLE